MKKSKIVTLVLITSALASCTVKKQEESKTKVYMKSDSTRNYHHTHHSMVPGIWYYGFRPYGYYDPTSNGYHSSGYHSNAVTRTNPHLSSSSSSSHSSSHSSTRGGFGRTGFSAGA